MKRILIVLFLILSKISFSQNEQWICVESDSFTIPFHGYMTSKFGKRWGQNHNGVDISLKTGDSVKVAWSGVIVSSEFNRGGYGNLVIVKHDNGLETYYAHLSKLLVSTGMIVKSGDIIGLGGNTGKSFGSHLHFEIRYSGTILNPESIINFYAYIKIKNRLILKNYFSQVITKMNF